MKIKRYEKNPIVIPGKYDWRMVASFNPACILKTENFICLREHAAVLSRFSAGSDF